MSYTLALVLVFWHLLLQYAPFVVGFAVPNIVEPFIDDMKSDAEKFWTEALICFVIAVLLNWNQINVGDPEAVGASFILILLQSEFAFHKFFNGSLVQQKIISLTQTPAEPEERG